MESSMVLKVSASSKPLMWIWEDKLFDGFLEYMGRILLLNLGEVFICAFLFT